MHSASIVTEASQTLYTKIAEQLKEVADVETIVECLGMETQRVGRRISILCPDHNDRHFKSCYLTDNGYRCFACGKSGDVIQLVQSVKQCSFIDACMYIAEIYGIQIDTNSQEERPYKKILNGNSLALIGLPRDKGAERVYVDLYPVDPIDMEDELGSEFRLRWEPVIDANDSSECPVGDTYKPSGYYVLQKLVCKNPLQTLLEEDETAYNDLICRKAVEAASKYGEMIDMAINPAKYYDANNVDKFIIAYYCARIAEEAGVGAWKQELERRIRECDNIRIEFSASEESVVHQYATKRRRASVFGPPKTGGASL